MKTTKYTYSKISFLLGVLMMTTISCERYLSDEAVFATYPNSPDIFIDGFTGGLDYYPYDNATAEAFSVDEETTYSGSASMRVDIPNAGSYAGASFILGDIEAQTGGRDLTAYNALTFWVKASQGATLDKVGFGQDFGDNKYEASLQNVPLTTNWTKVIIPIPDASKLIQERGMFWYSEDPENGLGYTIWFDEIKFESLGTIAQPRPSILNGQDQTFLINLGDSITIKDLSETFNLPDGEDVTVTATPSYYDFTSSNSSVAYVNESGVVTVSGRGETDANTGLIDNTAVISATLAGVRATGTLTIESVDINVISIFSDAYANIPVDNYNGFYQPYQTTLGGNIDETGNNIIDYTLFNFVAIEFYGRDGSNVEPFDGTEMEYLHIRIRANEIVQATDFFRIELNNNFTNSNEINGTYTINGSDLASNEWVEFDILLSDFNGLTVKDALGMMLFVSDGTIAKVSLDDIYFYSI